MTKRTKNVLGGFTILLIAAYLGFWGFSAYWLKSEIDRAYANAAKDGYEFIGSKPALRNFPLVPEVYYTGGFRAGNTEVLFPEMIIRGYPLTYANLTFNFPKGISLGGPVDPAIWSLDQLSATIIIPYHFPADFTQENLGLWQQQGGKIDVKNYTLTKQSLASSGKGFLSLDANLQPVFTFESTMRGYQAFIGEQHEKGLIEPFAAAAGTAILNGLSKIDPKTGENIVTLRVDVKDQMLSVGPLKALPLPLIVWDTRKPLAQLQ